MLIVCILDVIISWNMSPGGGGGGGGAKKGHGKSCKRTRSLKCASHSLPRSVPYKKKKYNWITQATDIIGDFTYPVALTVIYQCQTLP